MAAATLPAPGTKHGPCAEPCEHRDCATTRSMAAEPCIHCRQPIGYGVRFYAAGHVGGIAPAVYAHAACEESAAR